MKRPLSLLACLALGASVALLSPSAQAKRTGMNLPCHNCHEGQSPPQVTAEVSAARVEPGQSVTITVTATHATAKVGGVLVDSKGSGSFELIDSIGTRLFDDTTTQAVHATPQAYAGGQVQFSFRWVAPAVAGAAEFEVWSNAGNDNQMPADDASAETRLGVGVGCDGAWYYLDGDGDGGGEERTKLFSCEPVPGRILEGGDCNDAQPGIGPSSAEVCNNIDDNCDGQIDEGFSPTLLLTDADGDGFGSPAGMTLIGCPPLAGYAPNLDDCDDTNPAINPAALEVANGRDDDCNGRRDEMPATPGAGGGAAVPAPTPAPSSDAGCSVAELRPRGSSSRHLAALLLMALARRRAGSSSPRSPAIALGPRGLNRR